MKEEWKELEINNEIVTVSDRGRVKDNVIIEMYDNIKFVRTENNYFNLAKLVVMAFKDNVYHDYIMHENNDTTDCSIINLRVLGVRKLKERMKLLTKRTDTLKQRKQKIKYERLILANKKEKMLNKQLQLFSYLKDLNNRYQINASLDKII